MRMNGKKLTVLLGTAVLGHGYPGGLRQQRPGDNRSRDSRPGDRGRDRCRVFCCVRRHKRHRSSKGRECPVR